MHSPGFPFVSIIKDHSIDYQDPEISDQGYIKPNTIHVNKLHTRFQERERGQCSN